MNRYKLVLIFLFFSGQLFAQPKLVDSIRFFTDEKLIDIALTTDIKKLQGESKEDAFQGASIEMHMPDSTTISQDIQVCARGHFRRENCTIPPILLNFSSAVPTPLYKLGKLKLVLGCGNSSEDEQLIFKEYLIYKIYNLIDPKSFRVRLVRVTYHDTRNKVKSFTQYAFIIEDDAEMARRNGCKKLDVTGINTENTERATMTVVAVFEYLISNTDWSVPNNHNIKLIGNKKEPNAPPYAVPYDFDHSGLVNAGYATPSEVIGTESVTERVYRGFPRSKEELAIAFQVFNAKRDKINAVINDFTLLKDKTRREMIKYIDEFYETINSPRQVESVFIENARRN
jgi:hypothetical protein